MSRILPVFLPLTDCDPCRFLVLLLSPAGSGSSCLQLGRALGSLFTDQIFCQATAYKATSRAGLLRGLNTSLGEMTVLPPASWDPNTRLEPPRNTPSLEARLAHRSAIKERQRQYDEDDGYLEQVEEEEEDFNFNKVSDDSEETLNPLCCVRRWTTALRRSSSSQGSCSEAWLRMFAGNYPGTGRTSLTPSTFRSVRRLPRALLSHPLLPDAGLHHLHLPGDRHQGHHLRRFSQRHH